MEDGDSGEETIALIDEMTQRVPVSLCAHWIEIIAFIVGMTQRVPASLRSQLVYDS
jgi:hypothetical protein